MYAEHMQVNLIYCPLCRHKLRIPEDLMGQPVQCPSCQAEFVAPPPPVPERGVENAISSEPRYIGPADPEARSLGRVDDVQIAYDHETATRSGWGDSFVPAAGILLILVSLLGLADSLYRIFVALNPALMKKMMESLPKNLMMGPGLTPQNMQTIILVSGVLFALFSAVSIVGGFGMLRRRYFGLAVVGSILAAVNFMDCCCLLGAPVGIACLVLLFQPHIKASFQ
jgi:hypothetical protein